MFGYIKNPKYDALSTQWFVKLDRIVPPIYSSSPLRFRGTKALLNFSGKTSLCRTACRIATQVETWGKQYLQVTLSTRLFCVNKDEGHKILPLNLSNIDTNFPKFQSPVAVSAVLTAINCGLQKKIPLNHFQGKCQGKRDFPKKKPLHTKGKSCMRDQVFFQ